MTPRTVIFSASLGVVFLLLGCASKIGDSCTTSTECSAQGDRLCDTSQPGGYCTVPGCSEDSCPSEASCIAFRASVSQHADCEGTSSRTRLRRTYCMRRCHKDSDCRSDYACVDLARANPWGAIVVEEGQRHGKVCIVPASFDPELIEENDGQVCTGAESVEVPEPTVPATAGAGGGGGAAGGAGAPETAGGGGETAGSAGAGGSTDAGGSAGTTG